MPGMEGGGGGRGKSGGAAAIVLHSQGAHERCGGVKLWGPKKVGWATLERGGGAPQLHA